MSASSWACAQIVHGGFWNNAATLSRDEMASNMANRTFAVGDIHGDLDQLERLFSRLPKIDADDTIVFMGDYVDRGANSAGVITFVRSTVRKYTQAKVVALRGNHEDAWLRVRACGWPEFIVPAQNGCLACCRSFLGESTEGSDLPTERELSQMLTASFFPADVLQWMESLAYWYEDTHAIYVHAGLPKRKDSWLMPWQVDDPSILLWIRTADFFRNYRGKRVVVGHTSTDCLPPELSSHTPEDPLDMWAGENVLAIDTGCGKGGFLSAVELPAVKVYESRG